MSGHLPAPGPVAPFGPHGGRATALLSFTAGVTDTVSFVGLFGLFTAHVTGNFVLAGAALATREPGILVRLGMLPIFALAVAGGTLLARRAGAVRRLLDAELALLGAFLLVGILLPASARTEIGAPAVALLGALGTAAMGVQNALMRHIGPTLPSTTVMTGNCTALVADLVDLARGTGDPAVPRGARERLRRLLPAVLGFFAGAAVGALGLARVGYVTFAAPIIALGAVRALDRRAPPAP